MATIHHSQHLTDIYRLQQATILVKSSRKKKDHGHCAICSTLIIDPTTFIASTIS